MYSATILSYHNIVGYITLYYITRLRPSDSFGLRPALLEMITWRAVRSVIKHFIRPLNPPKTSAFRQLSLLPAFAYPFRGH